MDMKHRDMQFLGAFGIFKETYKIVIQNKKTFAIAALCFIHPLNYILSSLMETLIDLFRNLYEYGNISQLFSHHASLFWPFNVFSIIFSFGWSIYSTAGVSYTVAALYTGQEQSVKDTMRVVAKVWKRVLVTFLCVLLIFMAYHIVAGCVLFFIVLPFGKVGGTPLAVFCGFYFVGLLYLVVVLLLSGVVSVLEESCGFKAMAKSRLLLKGKMASATVIVLAICSSFVIILWLQTLVRKMILWSSMTIWMPMVGNLSVLLLILIFLLWRLVLETMFYFVCKSYHQENIGMSAISNQNKVLFSGSEC